MSFPVLSGNDLVTVKEWTPQSFAPVLFYSIEFFGTSVVLYLCSKNDGAHDYLAYLGHDYLARVKTQQIGSLQAFSTMGMDAWPSLSVTVADPDGVVFDYEQLYGFAGARLTATFAFYDPIAGTFSSDSALKFTGLCDAANASETTRTADVTIRATSDYDLSRKVCPSVPVQRICPWAFPSTSAQRRGGLTVRGTGYAPLATSSANQPFVIYSNCGYSPDQAGGLGNYESGTTPFTTCAHTKSDCQARGMYGTTGGSTPNSFGGSQWDPPAFFSGNSYTAQSKVTGFNNPNQSRFSQRVPETYGATWVSAVIMNVVGDPNFTRFECVFNYLQIAVASGTGVYQVLINNVLMPAAYSGVEKNGVGWWQLYGNGHIQGSFNGDVPYNSQSDPYGSMAMLEAVGVNQLQSSNGVPSIEVYLGDGYIDRSGGANGRPIPVWNSAGTSWTLTSTDLSAWVILDLLMRYLPSAKFDVPAFYNAAAICAGSVTYTNLVSNSSATHRRFGVSLTIDKPTALSQIVIGLRMSCNMIIRQNSAGAISCLIKSTLGEQQPSAVTGSNYNTAVASVDYTGSSKNGYYAYSFDESNYLDAEIKITQQPLNSLSNAINAAIQDEDNQNQADTVLIGDVEAVARAGKVITSTFTAIGFPNYDQANRTLNTYMAEQFRGNFYGGPGGTICVTIQSTVRVVHLNSGDLVAFTYQRYGWLMLPMRVKSLTPSADFETGTLELQFHSDTWYQDNYGQASDPLYSSTGALNVLAQAFPYPWQPNCIGNIAADWIYGEGQGANHFYAFQIAYGVAVSADSTALTSLVVTGYMPQNQAYSIQPPFVNPVGSTSSTGGLIPGGFTYYCYLAGFDGTNFGPCGRIPCIITVPSGTNTNTITIPIQFYPAGTTGVQLYVGTTPGFLVLSAQDTVGTPSSFTLTSVQSTGVGAR